MSGHACTLKDRIEALTDIFFTITLQWSRNQGGTGFLEFKQGGNVSLAT